MPQDYFDDSPEDAGKPTPSPNKENEESGDEQTFVLPKAIAGGKSFKPGDEMVVEIVAEHEDSFEVKYASEAPAEEEPTEEPQSDMPMKGGMMDSMME